MVILENQVGAKFASARNDATGARADVRAPTTGFRLKRPGKSADVWAGRTVGFFPGVWWQSKVPHAAMTDGPGWSGWRWRGKLAAHTGAREQWRGGAFCLR